MKHFCFTKVNNYCRKSLALSELNGTKKEKQGVCRETHLLHLKSFSLLNSGLYPIDY